MTSISCPGQLMSSIKQSIEGTNCSNNSSSSEEEYHDLVDALADTQPSKAMACSRENEIFISPESKPVSGVKRQRNNSVSAIDLLKAAKMAQAAGRGKKQQAAVLKKNSEVSRKINDCRISNLASRSNPAANRIGFNELRPSSELLYAIHPSSTEKCRTSSADCAKLEKAFHTVDTMAVVGRLCRVDGLMPDVALHVVYEYLRFIVLLVRCQDWNAAILWPSPMVDLAWRQHVLDTIRYLSDCQTICGRFLHYNPDAELVGQELCKAKYLRTLAFYRSAFGEPPRAIWPVEKDLFSGSFVFQQGASLNTRIIQIFCRIPSGTATAVEVNYDRCVGQIFERVKHWENISPETHIFVYNGEILDSNSLISTLQFSQGDIVDIIPNIRVRESI